MKRYRTRETVFLSNDNLTVRQTPHPDLTKAYVLKAVVAFISLEEETTLTVHSDKTMTGKESSISTGLAPSMV